MQEVNFKGIEDKIPSKLIYLKVLVNFFLSFFFFFLNLIYLFIFIFGCVGSSFLCEGFL